MCSILAKSWKLSEMAKTAYFLLIILNLGLNKSPLIQCYPKLVPDPDILIISLPKTIKNAGAG